MSIEIVGGGINRVKDGKGRLICDRGVLNVIEEENYQESVLNVLEDISEVVGQTLGPFGRFVLLTEPYGVSPVFPSKDGFRIMLNHKYDNPIYDTIYRIVRDISARMNEKVGDGTTSGNIIAYNFYREMLKYVRETKKITPAGIRNILKVTEEVVSKKLKESYVKRIDELSKEDKESVLLKVATVAANNDPTIGKIVTDVFNEYYQDSEAFVDTERSFTEKTYADPEMGFEIPMGFIHRSMVTEVDGMTCKYTNPFFLMIDGPLTKMDLHSFEVWVERICVELDRPLIVVAASFSQEVLNFLINVRAGVQVNGKMKSLKIAAIVCDSYSEIGNNRLLDIQTAIGGIALPTKDGVILDADKISATKITEYLGSAETFKSQMYNSRIIGGKGEKGKIDARIAELQREVESKSLQDSVAFQAHIATLKKRIAMLKSRMCTIYAGGLTYKEKESQRLLIEDAVSAVRSTIDHGYTLGGNVSISHLIAASLNEVSADIANLLIERKLNVCVGNDRDMILEATKWILKIIQQTSTSAYVKVLEHAGLTNIDDVILSCVGGENVSTYNLMTNEYEDLDKTSNLLVAGNTDIEIIGAVFAVTTTFLTSNRLMTMYHPGMGK